MPGTKIDPTTGAVTPPIHLSTTFERDPDGELSARVHVRAQRESEPRRARSGCRGSGRRRRPARHSAQGSAATAAMFSIARARRSRGCAHADAYYGTTQVAARFVCALGIGSHVCRHERPRRGEKRAAPKTKLLWTGDAVESALEDCRSRAPSRDRAHSAARLCVCDNTWAPIIQRPFDLGSRFRHAFDHEIFWRPLRCPRWDRCREK